ncbi:MAG: LysM peptidoglycan-binding domain-containing protein [Anaerolineae bacterium]|nr:LysM peptidoglycan-binding domain-containing protein [Anaerolineae bacterium]NOG49375.1 LysM peptidoglycan-binding domain-containing protein [Chloroflexota bacterium]GIK29265.1 MAG: hypothetical protein BroJett007_24030 [Chloroflexota bacterium]
MRSLHVPIQVLAAAGLLMLTLAACNFTPQPPTPTVEPITSPTASPTSEGPTATASLSPTSPPTVGPIRLASATPSVTPLPSTATATSTPTPGPYTYVVQSGDTLFGIIERFGYTDGRVIPDVLTLNPNIPSADNLPVGREILIPRRTSTPTPPGYEATVSMLGTRGVQVQQPISPNTEISCHQVQEGQTILEIAALYNTQLEVLANLNPEIIFRGCDFNNRSGGPDCVVRINIGQCVNAPLPTATPTLSPTPSGNETPTPTPTYNAPITVYPPNGSIVAGPITLEWVSVGVLAEDEYYYIELADRTAGLQYTQVTRDTSLRLPPELIPPDGAQHDVDWRVVVVRGSGENYSVIGGVMPSRSFRWQRR